jgi:hypothetical protein
MALRTIVIMVAAGSAMMRPPVVPAPPQRVIAPSLELVPADEFVQRLAAKYRGITFYRDQVIVREMMEREGSPSHCTESRLECVVDGGELAIDSAPSQVADAVLPEARPRLTPLLRKLLLKKRLWRAPHLGLAFCDPSLRDFRSGVDEGFTATVVEPVRVNDRELVRVELESPASDAGTKAVFGLFVNPESMLIERVEGEQPMADGSTYRTVIDITPISVIESLAPEPVDAAPATTAEPDVITDPLGFGSVPLL